jgi:hypothetical protein
MTRPRLRLLLASALVVGATIVSPASYALEGTVIDGSTGAPLAGVYVIGAWWVSISMPVKSMSGCSKLEVVRTDEQGRFALSTWSGSIRAHLFGDENLNDYYYLKGYRWETGRPSNRETVVLVPDTRSAIFQLDRIGQLMEKADCGPLEQRKVLALPMYQAMYDEARPMASSYDERRSLSSLLFMVESLAVGEKRAHDNSTARLNRGYQ